MGVADGLLLLVAFGLPRLALAVGARLGAVAGPAAGDLIRAAPAVGAAGRLQALFAGFVGGLLLGVEAGLDAGTVLGVGEGVAQGLPLVGAEAPPDVGVRPAPLQRGTIMYQKIPPSTSAEPPHVRPLAARDRPYRAHNQPQPAAAQNRRRPSRPTFRTPHHFTRSLAPLDLLDIP
ncbi:hypothetical protein AB0442_41280 [Kitasatospora sp. NPDC085895]|uniref:hypothetical protein n=1 Tax=Kitasatospora sp. NPDC085895 TaxID=3155057 RepID=UPI00344F83FC